MGCLYSIQSPSGKVYVGITMGSAVERFKNHRNDYRSSIGRAIKKYGRENCTLTELVYSDDWKVLCQLEKDYIKHFGTLSPGGYNQTCGGDATTFGIKMSEHMKSKISRSLYGNQRARGNIKTLDGRRRVSEANLGRKLSLEHLAKFFCLQALKNSAVNYYPYSVYDARFVAGNFDRLVKEMRGVLYV